MIVTSLNLLLFNHQANVYIFDRTYFVADERLWIPAPFLALFSPLGQGALKKSIWWQWTMKSLVVRLHFPAQLLYLVVSHLLRLSNAASSQKRVLTCNLKWVLQTRHIAVCQQTNRNRAEVDPIKKIWLVANLATSINWRWCLLKPRQSDCLMIKVQRKSLHLDTYSTLFFITQR